LSVFEHPINAPAATLSQAVGFPYLLEEFRFDMTLSDRLPDNMVEEARRQLTLDFRYS